MARLLLLLAVSLVATVVSAGSLLRRYEGKKQTTNLPLRESNNRNERLSITHWTSLEEPRSCLKKLRGCDRDDYELFFNGELTLSNVDVKDWSTWNRPGDGDWLKIRLAFDQSINKLRYPQS